MGDIKKKRLLYRRLQAFLQAESRGAIKSCLTLQTTNTNLRKLNTANNCASNASHLALVNSRLIAEGWHNTFAPGRRKKKKTLLFIYFCEPKSNKIDQTFARTSQTFGAYEHGDFSFPSCVKVPIPKKQPDESSKRLERKRTTTTAKKRRKNGREDKNQNYNRKTHHGAGKPQTNSILKHDT